MTSKTWWWNRNWRPVAKIVVGLFDLAVLAVAATLAVHVIWWLFDAGEYELRVGMPDFGRMASALVMLIAARAIVWAMLVRCCGYLGIGGLLVTFLLLVVVATGVPPPSGMMTARAHKMARVGHNIAQLIARNDLEADGPRIDPLTCTNSTEFIRRMMERASPEFKSSIGSRELWCVAVNVTDDAPNTFPLLFAANIDPTDIPLSWDGQSGAEEVIPFKMLPEAASLQAALRKCISGRQAKGWELKLMTVLRGFSHFNRLAVLLRLAQGPARYDELVDAMGVCVKSFYHHLHYLRCADLVTTDSIGGERVFVLVRPSHPVAVCLMKLLLSDRYASAAYYNPGSGRKTDRAEKTVMKRLSAHEGNSRTRWQTKKTMKSRSRPLLQEARDALAEPDKA